MSNAIDDDDELFREPLLDSENNEIDLLSKKSGSKVDDDASQSPSLTESSSNDGSTRGNSPPAVSCNIRLTLLYTGFVFAGRSLWSQSVLSTLVYLIRNNNPEAVGFITAAMGLSQLLVSFPAGILADYYRRDTMLKTASVVGIFAIGLTLISLRRRSFIWLTVALAVWGAFWGVANTSLGALFADSIPDGDRSKYFTQRSIIIKVGNMTGPTTALALFFYLGDQWTIHDCAFVMSVGQILGLPALMMLCFLNDDYAIQHIEEEEGLLIVPEANDEAENELDEGLQAPTGNSNEEIQSQPTELKICCCIPEKRIIPTMIAAADILSGLGSGMSIRYFPIFFVKNLNLSPVVVQILYIASPIFQAILMHTGQKLSKRFGRCRVSALYKWIGIGFMVSMILSYTFHLPRWVTCVFYLVRTSFMNATTALTKSVLMDNVPRKERAKWAALESVNMFSWSGSAFVGGMLVGFEGLIFNFCITASIQLLATVPLMVLFPTDALEEGSSAMYRSMSTNQLLTSDNSPQIVII